MEYIDTSRMFIPDIVLTRRIDITLRHTTLVLL